MRKNQKCLLSLLIFSNAALADIDGIWTISYTFKKNQYIDKIVIKSADDGYFKNSRFIYPSTLYTQSPIKDNVGFPTQCYFSTSLDQAYVCETNGVIDPNKGNNLTYKLYTFSISGTFSDPGNIITSGYFGSGTSDDIAYNIFFKNTPITGYKGDPPAPSAYQSTYNLIQWDKRGSNNDYCLDILSDDNIYYEGLHPIQCGSNMANFSPIDYVKRMNISLPKGFAFRWKVWSRTVDSQGKTVGNPNYAGQGYEGRIVVD